MPAALPPRPNLRFLQLQAKSLLKAQRFGQPDVCPILRALTRLRDAGDADILAAHISLQEAQFALARHYGFKSWADLRQHLQTLVRADDHSLDAVSLRPPAEVPEYAAAGVPLAVTAALNHAGQSLDFIDVAAGSGWAFSFGYHYDGIEPAYMAVRGRPGRDGPMEVFAFLPTQLGFDYALARTSEPDEVWSFVVEHVSRGVPIMSEHLDGGLITAYRGDGGDSGDRQIEFDGPVGAGWMPVEQLQPYAVYVLVPQREPLPVKQIAEMAVQRAARIGAPHVWDGVPQGQAALEAYLGDVANPDRDFAQCAEWFCWAAFERLLARKCAALWLRRMAELLGPPHDEPLNAAAEHYAAAYEHYEQYRATVMAGEPHAASLQQVARTPERIAVIAPLLSAGIAAEKRGLEAVQVAARKRG